MLTHLTVANYAVAEKVELTIRKGMTALTGETGAGKSIVMDALNLVSGARADAGAVREGADKADLSAVFDLSRIPQARTWLEERDLDQDGDCVLRRVIRRDGRSRGYINGQPCTLSDLKTLGSMLMDIHSQHQHQSLLKRETHHRLVDEFGGNHEQAEQVRNAFKEWRDLSQRLEQATNQRDERNARTELLRYQVEELDRLGLSADELTQLEAEQKQLANAENILSQCHEAAQCCGEGEPAAAGLLDQARQKLERLPIEVPQLAETCQMLEEARIQVEEAGDNLRRFIDDYDCDPQRLQDVEERLSWIYQVARKHQIQPTEIPEHQETLRAELDELENGSESLEQLRERAEAARAEWARLADGLSSARRHAAERLDAGVGEELRRLSMPDIQFQTYFSPSSAEGQPAGCGHEEMEFLVSTNAGQSARPLAKVASGGELSRISLAIQVVVAQTSTIPTLVFDEVDVGIGGGVAEVVGRLLRQLGDNGQILCVTHLPQVASQAHQHLSVSKFTEDEKTYSTVESLDSEERIREVARMLGGVDLTEQTMAHASEMLQKGQATHH
ncbi:DNA repair protein RecN [Salicola sp. Rm-C-2C1-2]|uniref:DNA repair protein RecN n=1 Tax=Salicola sp. Rm-C-2C1-2 TaxID=3141321 RepID=UPI0032E4B297